MEKIDLSKVKIPEIDCTESAFEQIYLMLSNDYTLENKDFRIDISGKGCDGFDYSCFFASRKDDDFVVSIENNSRVIHIIMNPFSAYYLTDTRLDYVQDHENNLEGFTVKNLNQDHFRGKFWKSSSEHVPPVL